MNKLKQLIFTSLAMLILFGYQAHASEYTADGKIAAIGINKDYFVMQVHQPYSNVTLSVSGPNGFSVSQLIKSTNFTVDLTEQNKLESGQYNYQITATNGEVEDNGQQINNGRGETGLKALKSSAQSGTFRISNGEVVASETRSYKRNSTSDEDDRDAL